MEATGTGFDYSEMHAQRLVRSPSQQRQPPDCRPNKRKRLSHRNSDPPAATCSSQPRALELAKNSGLPRLLQCSRAGEDVSISSLSRATRYFTPLEQTALATPAYDDGNLSLSQAYLDSRLHDDSSTIIDRSGHQHVPAMSVRDSHPVIRPSFSIGSPGAMSLASAQPTIEDGFAPTSSSPSTQSDGVERGYNPIYHHPQRWPDSRPPGAINPQRQFVSHPPPHPLSLSLSQPPSQPVPPSFDAGGGDYHNYGFLLPPQAHDVNAEFVTALPHNANGVTPGQHTTSLSSHTLHEAQILANPSSSQTSLLQHGHQDTFFPSHSALPGTEAAESPYQTAVPSLAAVSYTPQIESAIEVQHPHGEPHLPLHPGTYLSSTMGGGEFHPSQRQVLGNNAFSQAIHPFQDDHYRGMELTVSLGASKEDVSHSYHQMAADAAGRGASADSRVHEKASGDVSKVLKTRKIKSSSSDLMSSSEIGIKEEPGSTIVGKKRGHMNLNHRRQTAETRKRKACTRCRTQKMRCDIDPFDELGPCVGCKSFCKTSKKTLHLTPCFRGKITDAVLFRSGGLGLTKRWSGTEMKDVGNRINPAEIRTIEFTQGLWRTAIVVNVVAFEPEPTDVTARFWMLRDSDNDVRKKKELATYCLANVQETADYFERYVRSYAVEAMIEQRTGPVRIAGQRQGFLGVIEKTYMAAVKHYDDLKVKLAQVPDPDNDRELSLLHDLFTFWFARRHTTGSAYISGQDTLGMKPETKDDTYPLFGKVSLPRMIVAQFDSINHTRLLTRYGKKVLSELEALMMRNQPRWWFAIYVCLFILLREASWLSEDRYRHARQNHGKKLRYSVPSFVENLQEGCNNLLQHWHYYNCKPWPDPATPWDRHKSLLSELSSEHYDLVMETMTDPSVQKQLDIWRRYKKENGEVETSSLRPVLEGETAYQGSQTQYDWDHPFYWISQLFEEQWRAHPTYQSE